MLNLKIKEIQAFLKDEKQSNVTFQSKEKGRPYIEVIAIYKEFILFKYGGYGININNDNFFLTESNNATVNDLFKRFKIFKQSIQPRLNLDDEKLVM